MEQQIVEINKNCFGSDVRLLLLPLLDTHNIHTQKNELSEQGNDITQKIWNVYSAIELITDQQTTSEEPEDEELISKRKASTSSEPNSEPSQLNSSSGLNSSELTSGSSTNESNSNEDINESMLENVSSNDKKGDDEVHKIERDEVELEEFYRKMPTLETLYATVSKNLKQVDLNNQINNQLNDLITNGNRNLYVHYGRNANRLNGKFNRKANLSARTTPVQHHHQSITMNGNGDCEDANRKCFLLGVHSMQNGNSPNPNNNYYSDADSISYEAIDYLGSNSIDSGYKSSTPDYHSGVTNPIERRNGGRFSLDASIRSASSNSFNQYAPGLHSFEPHANDKLIKQYQELIAKSTANSTTSTVYSSGPMIANNNLMNKTGSLISSTELPLIDTVNESLASTAISNVANNEQNLNLINGCTFKSALALKSSNPTLMEADYCTVGRYKTKRHLSQSEQYLDNLNDDYDFIYPYLLSSTKSRHLFKNRSNLNLEQYLTRIKQQNEILKQEISESHYCPVSKPIMSSTAKVVKRKLPQINQIYANRSELVRNKLFASKQLHSSDMRLDRDEYQTNKYEHQARFRSIYMMNNRLRRQSQLSASIEQVSNLDGFYDEIRKRTTLSNSLNGDAINLGDYQANLIRQKNLIKQLNSNEFLTRPDEQQQDEKKLVDKLYSQVQKYQQKSSSTASIYYQDYLDNSQQIETATSLTTLVDPKTYQSNCQTVKSAELKELNKFDKNDQQEPRSDKKQDKHLKTRSTDDLYKSMSNLMNKQQLPNDATSKRRAFKLASPLRTLSKAFSSEASDLFRMKELAKSKFANLIDNFSSTNSTKKQPMQMKAKKCTTTNRPTDARHETSHCPTNQINGFVPANEETGNLYVYKQQFSKLQNKPLPDLPVEHLYEELKTKDQPAKDRQRTKIETAKIPEIRINYCKQRSIKDGQPADLVAKQSRSLEENRRVQSNELKLYSKSLDQEHEEEIIRKVMDKVNSDDIVTKIENVISNIDTMLNNNDTLTLEYKNAMK